LASLLDLRPGILDVLMDSRRFRQPGYRFRVQLD
jgi:hypothetical protein